MRTSVAGHLTIASQTLKDQISKVIRLEAIAEQAAVIVKMYGDGCRLEDLDIEVRELNSLIKASKGK